MSEDVQRTMVYIQQLQAMMRKPWSCDSAGPPGTPAPSGTDAEKEDTAGGDGGKKAPDQAPRKTPRKTRRKMPYPARRRGGLPVSLM